MKIICVTKDLKARLKEVFAEKAYTCKGKETENIQLHQVENEVWLYRRYLTKRSDRPIVKCCKFAEEVTEELKVPVKFYTQYFFEWLKWADDIQCFDVELNESNLRIELNYFVDFDERRTGHCDFTMDRVFDRDFIKDDSESVVDAGKLCSMIPMASKNVDAEPQLSKVYIDDGVMVATDRHCMKIKDIDSNYVGMVDEYGIPYNDGRYPNYKSILHGGYTYENKITLNKKTLKTILDSWIKQNKDVSKKANGNRPVKGLETRVIFDVGNDGSTIMYWQNLNRGETNTINLGVGSGEPMKFGIRADHFINILKDKDLKEDFDLYYKSGFEALTILQDHEFWLEMPIRLN